VIDIFQSAGSNYSFTKRGAYSSSNYGTKLCNGGKPLSKKHRDSFPNPINTTGLAKYLSEYMKKASVRTVMNYFTIPTDELLCRLNSMPVAMRILLKANGL